MRVISAEVTVHVVIWFYNQKYGFFTIDTADEFEGISQQLMAEEMGWA